MRVSINIPDDLVKQVDKCAHDLYLSRSAFISMCISLKLQADKMADVLPEIVKAYNDEREQKKNEE